MAEYRRDEPLIIECALNGASSQETNPRVPISGEELLADMLAVFEAGAAIAHQHDAIGPDGTADDMAAMSLELYRAVLAEWPDALLYPATAWGGSLQERWRHHAVLAEAGVLRTGFVDPGSVNLQVLDDDGVLAPLEFVYAHTPAEIRWWYEECERLRLAPNMSIFEPGFLQVALAYERADRMPAGAYVRFYFGGGEYLKSKPGPFSFGMPPTEPCLDAYLSMLEGSRLPWFVAVLAGDCVGSGIAQLAIERGGHVRVGLEDAAGARSESNAELVAEVAELARAAGRPVATPAEAAKLLGVPRPA